MTVLGLETGKITPEPHSKLYWAISDSYVLIKRSVRHIIRNLDQLITVVVLPVSILLLFRYVFGGAINTGDTTYVNYVIAGIIVLGAAFNATYTALSVCSDLQGGIIERFRSLPMLNSAVLTGHVVATLIRNLISVVIMVTVGLLVGFRPNADILEWAMVVGIVVLFSLALAWLVTILGLLAKSVEGASGYTFPLIFLPYLSSAFVPTATMPDILRVFSENQPITPVVETIRSLTIGTSMGNNGWLAVVWCIGIILVSYSIAIYIFKRKTMN